MFCMSIRCTRLLHEFRRCTGLFKSGKDTRKTRSPFGGIRSPNAGRIGEKPRLSSEAIASLFQVSADQRPARLLPRGVAMRSRDAPPQSPASIQTNAMGKDAGSAGLPPQHGFKEMHRTNQPTAARAASTLELRNHSLSSSSLGLRTPAEVELTVEPALSCKANEHARVAGSPLGSSADATASALEPAELSSKTQSSCVQPVSFPLSLLTKLLATVQGKQIPWAELVARRSEVLQMPLYAERGYWTTHYCCRNSATAMVPITKGKEMAKDGEVLRGCAAGLPPLLLCCADTGAGKSALVPLYVMDAHWLVLEASLRQAIQRTTALQPASTGRSEFFPGSSEPTDEDDVGAASRSTEGDINQEGGDGVRVFPMHSMEAFTTSFACCSRLCIVVSQPTRVACVALARYTATLLNKSSLNGAQNQRDDEIPAEELLGKRIGYAVGGESCFNAQTEIIFATPGYILNALRLAEGSASSQQVLNPTTLIVDEAHCRDLETDLLLASVVRARERHLLEPAFSGRGMGQLRQVFVMSATIDALHMARYLQTVGEPPVASPCELNPNNHVDVMKMMVKDDLGDSVWMLLKGQRQLLSELVQTLPQKLLTGGTCSEGSGFSQLQVPGGLGWWKAWKLAWMAHIATSQLDNAPLGGPISEITDSACSLPRPYRVESYFLHDLSGCFLESQVLFAPWQHPLSAPRNHTASKRSDVRSALHLSTASAPRTRMPPLLLTQDGQKLFSSLTQFFSFRYIKHGFHTHHANLVAQLLLHLLHVARLRWVDPAETRPLSYPALGSARARTQPLSPSAKHPFEGDPFATSVAAEPVAVMLFLPGFAEIQLVLQALERLCAGSQALCERHEVSEGGLAKRKPLSDFTPANVTSGGSPLSVVAAGEPVPILRYGEIVFSVPVLHAAAVGNPQGQLDTAMRCSAPLCLILSTAVAESGLTIPNLRVVVDSGLERRFMADPLTGTTQQETVVVNESSLRQRRGRAGRTCDGVVIHLLPRALLSPVLGATSPITSLASNVGERFNLQAQDYPLPSRALPKGQTDEPSFSTAASSPVVGTRVVRDNHLSGHKNSPATVLLRVKALFERDASEILASMPQPLSPLALEAAYRTLLDMNLLIPPPENGGGGAAADSVESHGLPSHRTTRVDRYYSPSLQALLRNCRLSPQGCIVATLPIPLEPALLVYHSLQFACVEDAILLACAMTVPTLLQAPRVIPTGSSSTSPLEHFYQLLATQRKLAGFAAPEAADGGPAAGLTAAAVRPEAGHLSEPLFLRSLLLRWYTCTDGESIHRFLTTFHINRSALRCVDVSVAQCCARLIELLHPHDQARTGTRLPNAKATQSNAMAAFSEGDLDALGARAAARLPDWPADYRHHLRRSLQRLRRAALARAPQRGSAGGLLQWTPEDARVGWLFRQHYYEEFNQCKSGSLSFSSFVPSSAALKSRLGGDASYRNRPGKDETGSGKRVLDLHPALRAAWRERSVGKQSRGSSSSSSSSLALYSSQDPARVLSRGSLVYTFGRLEDRLRAAFVAAFSRHTMRGEDGGYRRHHRRLRRNRGVLQDNLIQTCSFGIHFDAGVGLRGAGHVETRETVVSEALAPYFQGAGLEQVEVFATGTTAVARFASPESPSRRAARASPAESAERDETPLLRPEVLPCARGPPAKEAARGLVDRGGVQLAPFGVSLLIAAQGALQRVVAPLPPGPERGGGVAANPPAAAGPRGGSESGDRRLRVDGKSATAVRDGIRGVRGSWVGWIDSFGVEHRLDFGRVDQLGLGYLFPKEMGQPTEMSPDATQGSSLHTAEMLPQVNAIASPPASFAPTSPQISEGKQPSGEANASSRNLLSGVPSSLDTAGRAGENAVLSITPPIHYTRGIQWKAGLPSAVWLWQQYMQRQSAPFLSPYECPPCYGGDANAHAEAADDSKGEGEGEKAEGNQRTTVMTMREPKNRAGSFLQYCEVCQQTLIGGDAAFEMHCRQPFHLAHLEFAVAHHLHYSDWMQFACPQHARALFDRGEGMGSTTGSGLPGFRGTPAESLVLRGASTPFSANIGSVRTELYTCRPSNLSFLNALQWNYDDDGFSANLGGDTSRSALERSPPLAVAGGFTLSSSGLPSEVVLAPQETSADTYSELDGSSSNAELVGLLDRYKKQTSGFLTARHIWVLDFSPSPSEGAAAAQPPCAECAGHGSQSLLSSLLTLAGYLAGSSAWYPVSLLMNASHSHVHAVMLCDCGVWKLPMPLSVAQLSVLEEVMEGKTWPGLLELPEEAPTNSDETGAAAAPHEGLHWCVASVTCPESTFDAVAEPWWMRERRPGAVDHGAASLSPSTQVVRDVLRLDDKVPIYTIVGTTILLTLAEYIDARRNMVSLADFMERVIVKLDLLGANSFSNAHPLSAPHERRSDPEDSKRVLPRSAIASCSTSSASLLLPGTSPAGSKGGFRILIDFLRQRAEAEKNAGGFSSRGDSHRGSHSVSSPLDALLQLLRNLGCQFMSPPAALALLSHLSEAPAACHTADEEDWGRRLKYALSAGGASLESRFMPPPVVPSFLPSSGFRAALLKLCARQKRRSWMRSGSAVEGTQKGLDGAAFQNARSVGIRREGSLVGDDVFDGGRQSPRF